MWINSQLEQMRAGLTTRPPQCARQSVGRGSSQPTSAKGWRGRLSGNSVKLKRTVIVSDRGKVEELTLRFLPPRKRLRGSLGNTAPLSPRVLLFEAGCGR